MADAADRRDMLNAANSLQPLSLTVISNSEQEFSRLFSGFDFPVRYLAWQPDTFIEALRLHDLAWIPVRKNSFTICKSNNRLTQAIHSGVAVAADAIPSYEAFSDVCLLDPNAETLARYLADPARRKDHLAAGRACIDRDWNTASIADQWRVVLDRLSGKALTKPVRRMERVQ